MNEQNKLGRRFSIKWLVISLVSLPMMLACVLIVSISTMTLEQGMESETYKTLEAMARGTELALDGVSDGDYSMQGSDLYKGNVNLSQEMGALVENYARSLCFMVMCGARLQSRMRRAIRWWVQRRTPRLSQRLSTMATSIIGMISISMASCIMDIIFL